jgi:serine/threonine protein kinase
VIRGERYSEKADVYSFGIIMWEVVARKQPFAGRNFMGVSLDVLEGKRPQVPADCPEEFRKVMTKCWHAKPDKRPTMADVVAFLDKQIGDGGDLV